jgi:hypothetical protein
MAFRVANTRDGNRSPCCENCRDSDGKTRGILDYPGKKSSRLLGNKKGGLARHVRQSQTPSDWILSPLCLPFHHPGRTRFARHLPVPRTRARTWPASKSALLTAGLYTTPKSACKDTPKAQRSTIWGKLERGQKRLRLQSSTTNTSHRNRHGARLLTDTALTFSRKRHHSR